MLNQPTSVDAEESQEGKDEKMDFLLAAMSQPEIQDQAQSVREYLWAARQATGKIKELNDQNEKIMRKLNTVRCLSEGQKTVLGEKIEFNRVKCQELAKIRQGEKRHPQTLILAKIAHDLMATRSDLELESWPYQIDQILADIDKPRATLAPSFMKQIRDLVDDLAQKRKLSNDDTRFLIVLAALYRPL